MVIIMNTQLDKDDNDKWIGMGNLELFNNFASYSPSKARHSYGPRGHRGMSVLIFDATGVGYLKAERLSQHFTDNGRDRDAWDRRRVPFYPGGDRPLYGYMAERSDMEIFNQHCQGKSKLKYEMKSYIDMVVKQLRQMSEDNQKLIWFKNKVAKEQRHAKALKESYGVLSEKLRQTEEHSRAVRLRTKIHNKEKKEEMDIQEEFYKEQIQAMHDARVAKEDVFEKMQQEKRNDLTQSPSVASAVDPSHRLQQEVPRHCLVIKFIDDKLLGILNDDEDVRQVVLFTDGMDTRPYRLKWPRSCTIFDISPQKVHERATRSLMKNSSFVGSSN